MPKKKTTEEFIAEAQEVHGDFYDYSKVEYVNNNTKITIGCPVHGDYRTLPRIHLKKCGCPKCAGVRSDTENFIKKANQAHNNKYDYSKAVYIKSNQPVIVVCPIHGEFQVTPSNHQNGVGCPQCSKENRSLMMRHDVLGFGINDYDGVVSDNSRVFAIYDNWVQMIRRCYSEESLTEKPSYRGCSVCDEWRSFTAYLNWANDPKNGYREGYAMDKDIIKHGNRVYSPDACVFAPDKINTIFTKSNASRGDTPIGVSRAKNKFKASVTKNGVNVYLGHFNTAHEAFLAYKQAKEAYIKEVANEYWSRGEICEKLYNALLNYEVLETD
jgi:hypothetical protein